MSVPAAAVDNQIRVPIKGDRSLELDLNQLRVMLGGFNRAPITMFRLRDRIVTPEEDFDPGKVFWSNRDQGLYQFSDTLHKARKAVAHANSQYGTGDVFADDSETRRLEELLSTIPQLWEMVGDWKRMSPAQRTAYTDFCLGAINHKGMIKPRNDHKIRVRWQMEEASTGEDSLGRINPNAMKARLVTAGYEAEQRLREVRKISPRINRRLLEICAAMDWNMSIARKAHHDLAALKCDWMSSAHRSLNERLGNVMGDLQVTMDRPWRTTFRRCVEDDLRQAKAAIGSTRAIKYLDRAMLALELLEIYAELADLDMRISIELDRRPRKQRRVELRTERLASLKRELVVMISHVPIEWAADGRPVRDELGKVIAGPDKVFRNTVSPKLFERLSRADKAWVRGDWGKVKEGLNSSLASFG